MKPNYRFCCNPFNIFKHKRNNLKSLRWINEETVQQKLKINLQTLNGRFRICDRCRQKLNKMPIIDSESVSTGTLSSYSGTMSPCAMGSDFYQNTLHTENIEKFNESLRFMNESPIVKRKLQQKEYIIQKKRKIISAINDKVLQTTDQDYEEILSENKNNTEGKTIISKLKEQYENTNDRQLQMRILTLFANWSYNKIQRHFPSVSRYTISVVKKLVQEKGILSTPNANLGKRLPDDAVNKVTYFYNSEEISRVMAGQKDCITIRSRSGKEKVQKRLVLCNLKEAHALFKEKYPEVQVQFSKFAELRPKNCILAGGSGTHSVCVCCIHQNVKLMIDGAGLPRLTSDTLKIKTYEDCLSNIICKSPTSKCYLQQCDFCPGCDNLIEKLNELFTENIIDKISYKQWVTVDRTSLETIQSETSDFLEKLADKLRRLLTHSYIAKQQSNFFYWKKKDLQPGECVVICDFAENYSFVIQDSIQGSHWNNDQVTIHPIAIYYNDNEKEKFINYVAISECLKHDTIAVHLFQEGVIKFLKETLSSLKKFFTSQMEQVLNIKTRKILSTLHFTKMILM